MDNTILEKYNIGDEIEISELLELLKQNMEVTKNEISRIKSISVEKLPNQVYNNASEVKSRILRPITDEERGLVYILNKRLVLLTCLLEKMKASTDNLETIWIEKLSKLLPVIKNYLNDSKDTRIEFLDDVINIIHASRLVASFDSESGIIVKGDLEAKDLSLGGDIFANSPTAQARFNQIDFNDGVGENLKVSDIRSLDGTIYDTLHVGEKLYLGDMEIRAKLNEIIQDLLLLSKVIVNQIDEGEASISFSDGSITFEHLGNILARFSDNDGICFYDTAEFRKTIDAKKDIILNGESLARIIETLMSNYAEALKYIETQIAQEVKDRNAAIAALKASLIDGAPQALDTLIELSRALGNDPNFATTITNLINQKYEDSKKFTEDNFIRTDDLPLLLSNLTEADLNEVIKGVYD